MSEKTHHISLECMPDEVLANKIYLIRAQKVMLDTDLAQLYGVETKRLKEQVRRNKERFPNHFMFELTKEEYDLILRSHFATFEKSKKSKYLPFAFTEHGVLMLSNVLKSQQALLTSIRIIDVFVKLRESLTNYSNLKLEVEAVKNEIYKQTKRQDNHDKNLELLFKYLDELANNKEQEIKEKREIGFKISRTKNHS